MSNKIKAMGAIPPGYMSEDGMLLIGGRGVAALADEAAETPFFAYDVELLRARMASLRAAMPPELSIHYAMKANPFSPLLALMSQLVDGFDIASSGELALARNAGVAASRISFAGPGKTDDELDAALAIGVTINLESQGEAERALDLAARRGVPPRLAIRVNPDFELKGSGMRMGGGARPFGVDAEHAGALARQIIAAGAQWRGWHVFAGSQSLDGGAILAAQAAALDLVTRLSDEAGAPPPLVNLGGGFGVPYFPGDVPLDLNMLGAGLAELLAARSPILKDSEFALELGRFLVAEAGVYITRVVEVKESRGERFAIVDGGLHHQLAASGNFGTVVRRNYPLALANRFDDLPTEAPTHVVGCLCTPLDRLGDAVALPEVSRGDLIAIFMAGAYGASASPAAFLGHKPAVELLVEED